MVSKRRADIDRETLSFLLQNRLGDAMARLQGSEVLKTFIAEMAWKSAVIPMVVDYNREAYIHRDPRIYLRCTIDDSFTFYSSTDFFDPCDSRRTDPSTVIVEVKTVDTPPSWLQYLIRKYRLNQQPFSKFQMGCSVYSPY